MRKTKIVCKSITQHRGKNNAATCGIVARLNFSHSSHEYHQNMIDIIKKVREKLGLPIAIMLDTKGPEYRIKTFENGQITLSEGDNFTFTTEDIVGNRNIVSVNYKDLPEELSKGDRILLNNGLIVCEVDEISGKQIQMHS